MGAAFESPGQLIKYKSSELSMGANHFKHIVWHRIPLERVVRRLRVVGFCTHDLKTGHRSYVFCTGMYIFGILPRTWTWPSTTISLVRYWIYRLYDTPPGTILYFSLDMFSLLGNISRKGCWRMLCPTGSESPPGLLQVLKTYAPNWWKFGEPRFTSGQLMDARAGIIYCLSTFRPQV